MIYFDCNGCGKCCEKTTPSITLEEFLRLYDKMPVVLLFEYSRVKKFSYSGFDFDINGHEYSIMGQILSIPTSTGCVNLNKDKQCDIYNERPSACALYPINPGIEVKRVEQSLIKEKESNNTYDLYYCEGWENSEKVIFKNGSLTNSNNVDLINKRVVEDKITSELLKNMFFELMKFDYVKNEFNDNNENGEILICTEDFLSFLHQERVIENNLHKKMLSYQKELFNKSLLNYKDGEDDQYFIDAKKIVEYNISQFE
jgi:Fe-S-cluster containining protein